jgi:hypothetical protein
MRNTDKILVGKLEEKRPLGRHRRMWEDNNVMDLKGRCKNVHWVHLTQDRDQWWAYVDTVMNFRVPYSVGNFLTS